MAKSGWLDKLGKGLEGAVKTVERIAEMTVSEARQSELRRAESGKLYDGFTLQQWERRWESIGTINSHSVIAGLAWHAQSRQIGGSAIGA